MPKRFEWIVSRAPVRDADRRGGAGGGFDGSPLPAGKAGAEPRRGQRLAELHRQVREGVYDNMSTIDVVARRILQSGDL
jgi:hypothetical protein